MIDSSYSTRTLYNIFSFPEVTLKQTKKENKKTNCQLTIDILPNKMSNQRNDSAEYQQQDKRICTEVSGS